MRFLGYFLEAVLVLGAIAVFLAIATHNILLPGLYYDEAADAVPAMQMVLHQPVDYFRGAGIELFGQKWPLMVMDYVGSVSTYLLAISIMYFGVTVQAVRAVPIAGGVLTLLLGYGLLRSLLGPSAALIAIWLTAIHPSFVFWTRQGIHVSSIMTVCSLAAMWLLLGWWRGGGAWRLIPAAFLLGLGVSIKILFLWVIAALVVIAVLLRFPFLAKRPLLRWWDIAAGVLALPMFALGAGLIILYNIQTQGTIKILQENAVTTSYGVDNRDVVHNFLARIDAFGAYLRSEHFWYLGQLHANLSYDYIFMIAVGLLVLMTIAAPKYRPLWRRPAFLLLFIALIVVQSTITVSQLGPTHFYILYPLPQAVIALAAVWFVKALPRRWWPFIGVAGVYATAALALLAGWDLQTDADYHEALARTGGVGTHSESIYDLTEYLMEWKGHHPVAMDWGISKSVQYLSKGTVNPPELFGYTGGVTPENYIDVLQPYVEDRWTLYIFHDSKFAVFDRQPEFFEAAKLNGKKAHPDLYITQRDERIIFVLFTLRPPDEPPS